MTPNFFKSLASRIVNRRQSRARRDIEHLSAHMQADIGYPKPDQIGRLSDFPYNFRI